MNRADERDIVSVETAAAGGGIGELRVFRECERRSEYWTDPEGENMCSLCELVNEDRNRLHVSRRQGVSAAIRLAATHLIRSLNFMPVHREVRASMCVPMAEYCRIGVDLAVDFQDEKVWVRDILFVRQDRLFRTDRHQADTVKGCMCGDSYL
jgi:hypothetical protein